MGTEKLYWLEPYRQDFTSRVVAVADRPARIYLEGTCFYPTGGGQPNDTGSLGGFEVTDVVSEKDGRIAHVVTATYEELTKRCPEGTELAGKINWDRRIDFMECHTGQHILSQAFERVENSQTIGFHLTSESLTIDLDNVSLTKEQLDEAEAITNRVIEQSIEIKAAYFDKIEEAVAAGAIRIKTLPDGSTVSYDGDVGGSSGLAPGSKIRIVSVGDFDSCPCSGTHLKNSAEVKLVKILKTEKKGDKKLRLHFVCGRRAIADYTAKLRVIDQLTLIGTCGWLDLPQIMSNYREQWQSLKREKKKIEASFFQLRSDKLWTRALEAPITDNADGVATYARVIEHGGEKFHLFVEYMTSLSRESAREYQRGFFEEIGGATRPKCLVCLLGQIDQNTLCLLVKRHPDLTVISARDLLRNVIKGQGGGNDGLAEGIMKIQGKPNAAISALFERLSNNFDT